MTLLAFIDITGLIIVLIRCSCELADKLRERSELRYQQRKRRYRHDAYYNSALELTSVEGRARALAIAYSLREEVKK